MKIDNLSKAIVDTLTAYTNEVKEEVVRASDELSKEGITQLKARSPVESGKYKRGWARRKSKDGYVLYNRVYQLTHLLEYGHAKVGGGRVPARVHIRPVEEELIQAFENRIEKVARG